MLAELRMSSVTFGFSQPWKFPVAVRSIEDACGRNPGHVALITGRCRKRRRLEAAQ